MISIVSLGHTLLTPKLWQSLPLDLFRQISPLLHVTIATRKDKKGRKNYARVTHRAIKSGKRVESGGVGKADWGEPKCGGDV